MPKPSLSEEGATQLIGQLKPAPGVFVWSAKDRRKIIKCGRTLRAAGAIDFQVVTRSRPKGCFIIFAVSDPE